MAIDSFPYILIGHLIRRTVFLSAVEDVPQQLLTKKIIHGEDWFLFLSIARRARAF
ncbi:MAG: hypothetical protein LBP65_00815 [Puniceicoccales bacterium]|nr:hypothetical protein [Puniceicoccales bacterium]